jgi:hypothetical protein
MYLIGIWIASGRIRMHGVPDHEKRLERDHRLIVLDKHEDPFRSHCDAASAIERLPKLLPLRLSYKPLLNALIIPGGVNINEDLFGINRDGLDTNVAQNAPEG